MEKGENKKRVRFGSKTILEAVRLVESGVPRQEVAVQFGCAGVTLEGWMKTYGSEHYHQNKRRTYSKTEKRSIMTSIANGMILKEVQVSYGLNSTKTIESWMRQWKAEKFDLCVSEEKPMARNKKEQEPEDVAALRRELELAKLKIEALNTLIDVAEDQLKIDIRKKSGAGRSSK